jgi:hypothetical protein
MQTPDFWFIDSDLNKAMARASDLPQTRALGYVYVLALSNDTRKLGSTSHLIQRLAQHRTETARYSVTITHCLVTRPHFNFRTVEAQALHWIGTEGRREIVAAALSDVRRAVEAQTLHWIAPHDYVKQHRSAQVFYAWIMQQIAASLGIGTDSQLTCEASQILDVHRELGCRTGLSPSASTLNALAVIEAQSGLDLSALRGVLQEVV